MGGRGRPATFPIKDLEPFFLSEAASIVLTDGRIASRGADVWARISSAFKEVKDLTPRYLHLLVSEGRYGLHDTLGIDASEQNSVTECDNVDDVEESNTFPEPGRKRMKISFNIVLSKEEWADISPLTLFYDTKQNGKSVRRSYKALKPYTWSHVIHEHVYAHTKIPCNLRYSDGKVREDPPPYICITANCSHCGCVLTGQIEDEPSPQQKVLISCELNGDVDVGHKHPKRQLRGEPRRRLGESLVQRNVSATTQRNLEAEEKMKEGDTEPSHVFQSGTYKTAKWEARKSNKLDEDPVLAVIKMKHKSPFSSYIKDVTYEKLVIHFYSTSQIHASVKHVSDHTHSAMSIDATGGVVDKIRRDDGRLSGHIFLYEVVISDSTVSFPVCSMLSERQDAETIRHWLQRFFLDGAVPPRELVLDMSKALMNACLEVFTDFNTTSQYLNECAKILRNEASKLDLPSTFIRNDVNHTMKLFSSLSSLHASKIPRRSRQFYLRCLGQLLQCVDIRDAEQLLKHIIIVALSETLGHTAKGIPTACHISKEFLRKRIATGVVVSDEWIDYDVDQDCDTARIMLHTSYLGDETDALGKGKPFLVWAESIVAECQELVSVEGNEDNMQFLPALVPELLRLVEDLPFWSAVMVPHYGFGGPTASSALSESSFRVRKNVWFSHMNLPVRVDEFLETCILIQSGAVKLHHAESFSTREMDTKQKHLDQVSLEGSEIDDPPEPIDNGLPKDCSETMTKDGCNSESRDLKVDEDKKMVTEDTYEEVTVCSSCRTALNDDSKNCLFCNLVIHDRCSVPVTDEKNVIGLSCIRCDLLTDDEKAQCLEKRAQENWMGQASLPIKKRSSYLNPQSEWEDVDLDKPGNVTKISLIKNGNSSSLKAVTVEKKTYSLANTCAFDSFIQILTAAYVDSRAYRQYLHEHCNEWSLLEVLKQLSSKKISHGLYMKRAVILLPHFPVHKTVGSHYRVQCETNISQVVAAVVADKAPSLQVTSTCDSPDCVKEVRSNSEAIIGIGLRKERFSGLEAAVNKACTNSQLMTDCLETMLSNSQSVHQKIDTSLSANALCTGNREERKVVNEGHLFLEIIEENDLLLVQCILKLNELPVRLNVKGITYILRGAVAYRGGTQMKGIGHYVGFCRRSNGLWECYDDLANKPVNAAAASKVVCHLVVYTI